MKLTKTQLRQIIKEEIQKIKSQKTLNEGLLTEATRSQIGVIGKDGNIISTYIHWDGYPKGVGKIAKKYYSKGKIRQLLQVDNGGGIQSLGSRMDGGPEAEEDQTVFYGRDLGETGGRFMKGKLDAVSSYIKKANKTEGAQYVYLYNEKDGKWYYADTHSDKQLKPL